MAHILTKQICDYIFIIFKTGLKVSVLVCFFEELSPTFRIFDYYFTTNNGLIAWVKLDSAIISEIHQRAAKAAFKEFRSVTYIPKLARDRKLAVD